jgi:TonB-dependent SusC/RagA subfamily outer membrane receptor
METHDKLLQQFKDAAAQDETKPFAASEAVWQKVAVKLDHNEKQPVPWLRYASIAAVVLLLAAISIVMQLNKPEATGRKMARVQPATIADNRATTGSQLNMSVNDHTEMATTEKKDAPATDKTRTQVSVRPQPVATGRITAEQTDKIPVANVVPATDNIGNHIAMQGQQLQALSQEQYKYREATNALPAQQLEKRPATDIVKALEGTAPGIQPTNGNGQPGAASTYQSEQVDSKPYISSGTDSAVMVRSDMRKRNITDVTKAIEGAAPEIQTTSACSGVPDDRNASISIRGMASISAGNAPLIIVDGALYNGSLNAIDPKIIKNITVLKDAAATSLYGARAANGAIIITTKHGKGIREHRKGFFRRLWGGQHKTVN